MNDEVAPYLLHCTNTTLHQDVYDRLPVLLRIQLFNSRLLKPPKEYSEHNSNINVDNDTKEQSIKYNFINVDNDIEDPSGKFISSSST